MTKTKAKREPTYLLDCVLPPTDVIADGFLAKHRQKVKSGWWYQPLVTVHKSNPTGRSESSQACHRFESPS